MKLDSLIFKIKWFFGFIFNLKKPCHMCKCKTKRFTIHKIIRNGKNKKVRFNQPKEEFYCDKCVEKMTISCAWCGNSILPSSPITLYRADENYSPLSSATPYGKGFIGCLAWECGEAWDRGGFWVPPGKVERCLTPMEECYLRAKAGDQGVLIKNDIGNPNGAIFIKE